MGRQLASLNFPRFALLFASDETCGRAQDKLVLASTRRRRPNWPVPQMQPEMTLPLQSSRRGPKAATFRAWQALSRPRLRRLRRDAHGDWWRLAAGAAGVLRETLGVDDCLQQGDSEPPAAALAGLQLVAGGRACAGRAELRPRPGRLRDASVAPGHLVAGAGAAEAAGAQRGGLDHGRQQLPVVAHGAAAAGHG
ncbi:unnamed protein product, partial [Effrenium voratum]